MYQCCKAAPFTVNLAQGGKRLMLRLISTVLRSRIFFYVHLRQRRRDFFERTILYYSCVTNAAYLTHLLLNASRFRNANISFDFYNLFHAGPLKKRPFYEFAQVTEP
jgi:hypothetical protein